MDPSGLSSAEIHTAIEETVHPHTEEVETFGNNPDVKHHPAADNINPKMEASDKPAEPTKLPSIGTFAADSGLGGKNPIIF